MKSPQAMSVIISLAIILTLPAVGASAPKCSDEAVIAVVISECEEVLGNLVMRRVAKDNGLHTSLLHTLPYLKAKALKTGRDEPRYTRIIEQVEALIKDASISLKSIRSRGALSSVDKLYCEADLHFANNGKEFPISYSAQLHDDGELYVDVDGL